MASVALLTVTGILSQAVGFAYRVGLTRLAGAEIMGLYQLHPAGLLHPALPDLRGPDHGRLQSLRLVPGPGRPAGHLAGAGAGHSAVFPFSGAPLHSAAALFRRRLRLSFGRRPDAPGADAARPLPAADGRGELAEALLLRDRTGLPGGHDGIGRDGPAGCLGPLAGQGPLPCHGGGCGRGHRPGHGPV